jgi:hypothetical protein
MPTRAPWLAAMRAQRTPPLPPPMTNRSKSGMSLTLEKGSSSFLKKRTQKLCSLVRAPMSKSLLFLF